MVSDFAIAKHCMAELFSRKSVLNTFGIDVSLITGAHLKHFINASFCSREIAYILLDFAPCCYNLVRTYRSISP